jgi:hypothetical protein
VGGVLTLNLLTSLPTIRSAPVQISAETIRLGVWFQEKTPSQAGFLFLSGRQDEAEWMAYFLRRTPAVGFWGSEWTGDYDRQYRLTLVELPRCLAEASLGCIEEMIEREGLQADYIVLPKGLFDGEIESALKDSGRWREVYRNEGYRVWVRAEAGIRWQGMIPLAALARYRPSLSINGR